MTRASSSLRGRLILTNASLLTICLFSFSLLLYTAFGRALSAHFDARLAADAASIAHTIEENADGSWEFEGLNEFERMFDGAYFEVRLDDHRVFARSRLLADRALHLETSSPDPSVQTIVMPDGLVGRRYSASLLPRADEALGKPSGRRIRVTVARSTAELDAALSTLRLLLWISGLSVLLVVSIVGVVTIGRGLKPLRRLLSRVDAIDATRLGERLPLDDLPRELQPVALKLNELLSRIEASFAREREWNTAVSHELRTPLAGLRAILDVSLSRDRSAHDYRAALGDSRQVVTQMNQLVDQLLLLARLDARAWALTRDRVELRQLVDFCFAVQLPKARARSIQFDNRVPAELRVSSDLAKLRIVISNLISNAVEYAAEGGEIRVESDVQVGCLLAISNLGPPIPEAELQHIFEPFVRMEWARSGSGEHAGIGLTLVRALCEVLGLSVNAQNRADGWVVFSVRADKPGEIELLARDAADPTSETLGAAALHTEAASRG